MIITVIVTYIGLFMFEDLPTSLVVGGLVAQVRLLSPNLVNNLIETFQVSHLALLSSFPFFSVSSPSFLLSVVMVLINHYFAFSFFGEKYYPFSEVRLQ